jgi:hypothetical protein
MASGSMRDSRKHRSLMLRNLLLCVFVIVYLWPWYILLTRKVGPGEDSPIPTDSRKLRGGGIKGKPSIVAFIGVQVDTHLKNV